MLLISSSYAKILRETNFHAWEIPGSGLKAEDGKKERKEERRAKVGDNNGQATHGARKPPGPKLKTESPVDTYELNLLNRVIISL